MPRPDYRIAFIVDSLEVPKWVRDLADWARGHPTIELAALIVHSPRDDLFDKLLRLEGKFLSRKAQYRAYAERHFIGGAAPVQIDAQPRVAASDLLKIAELDLDAIVLCGRATPADWMAGAARDGVISVTGGSSAGFVEVLDGRPDTPFTIERLRNPREAREVLFSGSVATALLYGWNAIAVQARAFPYLRTTLERLASGSAQPLGKADAVTEKPRAMDLMAYALKTARRSVGKGYRRYSGREFNFQVAFTRRGWPHCQFDRGTLIPNPAGAFLADPFAITVDGSDYLFVEEFPFDTRKGVISAYRLTEAGAERIGVVLEEPHHLSFPFLFEHDDDIYMVPESGADRSIRLYKATGFPTAWAEVKVLRDDVAAVDTIVFKNDGLWWMFTTIQGEGPGLNNAELHAFYADDPLGDWTPHQLNPIVMDATRGRNGGFIRDADGAPCRVAQVPGFTFYGAASAVYRIDALSPTTYRESLIREVRPTFFSKLDGTHHIHSANGLTVYDFMRVERPAMAARRDQRMKASNDDVRLAG